MRKVRIISSIVLTLALITTLTGAYINNHTQNMSGGYSSVCTISKRAERWILNKFGHCKTVEELMLAVDDYACKNFTYVSKGFYIQHFDLDKFIFKDKLHGLCFDFSCFNKCIFQVVKKHHKEFNDVKVYVCDVRLSDDSGHSYNFICTSNKSYYIDITSDNTRYNKGLQPIGYEDFTGLTFEQYVAKYDEKITNLH